MNQMYEIFKDEQGFSKFNEAFEQAKYITDCLPRCNPSNTLQSILQTILKNDYLYALSQEIEGNSSFSDPVIVSGVNQLTQERNRLSKTLELDFLLKAFKYLSSTYDELRTDVSEFATMILERFEKKDFSRYRHEPECRFIRAKIPWGEVEIEVEYDTLVTEIFFKDPVEGDWHQAEGHSYIKN